MNSCAAFLPREENEADFAARRRNGEYMQYLIMSRSLTNAQRSAALLERKGITAHVVKAPRELAAGGCGYAISLTNSLGPAVSILNQNNMKMGKKYVLTDSGYEEVK